MGALYSGFLDSRHALGRIAISNISVRVRLALVSGGRAPCGGPRGRRIGCGSLSFCSPPALFYLRAFGTLLLATAPPTAVVRLRHDAGIHRAAGAETGRVWVPSPRNHGERGKWAFGRTGGGPLLLLLLLSSLLSLRFLAAVFFGAGFAGS